MIDPNAFRELLAETTAVLPAIRKTEIVVTDDEFVEALGEVRNTDNIILVAVLPSYSGYGQEDNAGMVSYMQFFFLEKTDYKALKNQEDKMAIYQRTVLAARDFIGQLFGVGILSCSAEQLQYDFQLRPVARKAQCNGYELQIDSKAFIDFL